MTHHDDPKDHKAPGDDAAIPTAQAGEAVAHLGQDDADDAKREKKQGLSSAPPRQPGGLASGLQPGGMAPGGGPGASAGSIGTSGGQTGGAASGSVKKSGI